MIVLLVIGFVCNELIKPGERQVPRAESGPPPRQERRHDRTRAESARRRPVNPVLIGLAWLWVLIPFGYGLYQLVIKIPALFGT